MCSRQFLHSPSKPLSVQDMQSHVYGNPHSLQSWAPMEGSAQAVAEARRLTLEMCNASAADYECIFTSGATGVCFSSPSCLCYAAQAAKCVGACCGQDDHLS